MTGIIEPGIAIQITAAITPLFNLADEERILNSFAKYYYLPYDERSA
jgi:hypothetical protein